jgi:hypothetical protein
MYIGAQNARELKAPNKGGLSPKILSKEGHSAFGSVRRKILKI